MMNILELYNELYNRLKTKGLDYLLENSQFDEYSKRALKIISQLPYPIEVDLEKISETCEECSRGSLELVFHIDGIGNLAREILQIVRESGEYGINQTTKPRPYDPESVTDMLNWNNNMMLNISFGINRLIRHADINLKGRCPSCHGDLVEVIFYDKVKQTNELRIRCKQQIKSDCQNVDWYIQDLDKRKP